MIPDELPEAINQGDYMAKRITVTLTKRQQGEAHDRKIHSDALFDEAKEGLAFNRPIKKGSKQLAKDLLPEIDAVAADRKERLTPEYSAKRAELQRRIAERVKLKAGEPDVETHEFDSMFEFSDSTSKPTIKSQERAVEAATASIMQDPIMQQLLGYSSTPKPQQPKVTTMAKASTTTKPKRYRSSPETIAEIVLKLDAGSTPEMLADEYGKSVQTIKGYAHEAAIRLDRDPRAAKPVARSSPKAPQQAPTGEPDLITRLLNYAVATLEGKDVDQAEIDELKEAIEKIKSRAVITNLLGI